MPLLVASRLHAIPLAAEVQPGVCIHKRTRLLAALATFGARPPVGGWISDRLTRRYGTRVGRCGIAVAGIGLASIFIALGTLVHSPQIASVVLAGGAGALYLSQSSFWSVSADIGGRSAGSVSGLMNMGGQIGGALTASATPAIASHLGWSASFLVAAALCACGALAWLGVERKGSVVGESVVGMK